MPTGRTGRLRGSEPDCNTRPRLAGVERPAGVVGRSRAVACRSHRSGSSRKQSRTKTSRGIVAAACRISKRRVHTAQHSNRSLRNSTIESCPNVTCKRAGMQLYQVDGGKLVKTWFALLNLGFSWCDAAGQEQGPKEHDRPGSFWPTVFRTSRPKCLRY
jgi:hypothetical protein